MLNSKGLVWELVTPFPYVPMRIKSKAAVMPGERKEEFEWSFKFPPYSHHAWIIPVGSWVSSIIYHINCSIPYNITQQYVSHFNVHSHCLEMNDKFHAKINVSSSKPYVLHLSLANCSFLQSFTLMLNTTTYMSTSSVVAKLTASSIRKSLCGKGYYVYYKSYHILSNEMVWTKSILRCAEHKVVTYLYDYDFDASGKYEIYVHIVNKSKLTLKFDNNFLNKRNFIYAKYNISYPYLNLADEKLWETYVTKYKLFYTSNSTSWYVAYSKCKQQNLVLPNFNSRKHMLQVMTFIFKRYSFYPVALFVGLIKHVSIYNIFFK